MTERFRNKYRVPSARLSAHDYGSPGNYFITICVEGRQPVFGELLGGAMTLNALGEMASKYWAGIPGHFPNMSVDEFIIMPDHMHGILSLNHIVDDRRADLRRNGIPDPGPNGTISAVRGPDVGGRDVALQRLYAGPRERPGEQSGESENARMRAISPLAGSIPAAVRSYKAALKRWAGQNGFAEFGWQSRYWDAIVRDDESLERVRNYIRDNPRRAHSVDADGNDT